MKHVFTVQIESHIINQIHLLASDMFIGANGGGGCDGGRSTTLFASEKESIKPYMTGRKR